MPYTGQQYAQHYYGSVEFPPNSFLIAGVNNYYKICEKIETDDVLLCIPEPTNEYDPNAIMIKTQVGELCGYVPKENTQYILTSNITRVIVINKKRHDGKYGLRVDPIVLTYSPEDDEQDNDEQNDEPNITKCSSYHVDKISS